MKKTLFINGSVYLPGEGAIKRTFYLFDMMRNQGQDVHLLTSDFNHYNKQKRDIDKFYSEYPEYKDHIHFIHKYPYKRNISVLRFLSRYLYGKTLSKWLKKNITKYDVVYVSIPSSVHVATLQKYCNHSHTKLVIDVNDLWPDSLKLVIKNTTLYNAATYFMRKNIQKDYAAADGIVAVSEEYLDIASAVNTRATARLPVYIGAMIERFDQGVALYADEVNKPENEFWIAYIGTLGRSYDLETVILAVNKLRKEHAVPVRFKVMGHGPEEHHLREIANSMEDGGTDFLGFVDYEHMAAILSKCDVGINCIKNRASQSIINKVSDYFASGKPLLNCGPCKEMASLIDDYQTGINYEAENVDSLCEAILTLYNNASQSAEMGENSRKLAMLKFDRQTTHQEIISLIDAI